MRTRTLYLLLLILTSSAAVLPASAQSQLAYYDFTRGGLDWRTIETEHFRVHYHKNDSLGEPTRTATAVANIAEDIYAPITDLYGNEPNTKVSIVLKDYEDYSNGAAYFFDNVIHIWAPSLDSRLRGDHGWLKNVITHEFTHIVQVQATMKASRGMPFIYFQLLTYENVRRPDVLYGYPNGIVTYPIPVLNNPAWFAEGTAQYMRSFIDYDQWDSHRDMLLRTRILAREELSLADMGGFYSHNSLKRESVYNHGFAFTQYLAGRFGEHALADISSSLGKWRNWNFERATRDAEGISGREVYDDWIAELRSGYVAATGEIVDNVVEGELIESEGFNNFHPRYSPSGRRILYVSNKGQDYNRLSLVVKDMHDEQEWAIGLDDVGGGGRLVHTCRYGERIAAAASSSGSWRPDEEAVVFSRRKLTSDGYLYDDLFEVNLETKKETRLTYRERATQPVYAPDGNSIAFVSQADGTTNLVLLSLDTKSTRRLTQYNDGTQVTDPVWHPDGGSLFVGVSTEHGRDIFRVRLADGVLEPVVAGVADERTPALSADGTVLYYASDETGIFNIYRVGLDTLKAPEAVTNVVGGALSPTVSLDGDIAYASFQWDGYRIRRISGSAVRPLFLDYEYEPPALLTKATERHRTSEVVTPGPPGAVAAVFDENPTPVTGGLEEEPDRSGEPVVASAAYRRDFTSFSFFPAVRLDQYVSRRRSTAQVRLRDRTRGEALARNVKLGTYFTSREIIDGLSLTGGVLVGPASRTASSIGDYFAPSSLLKLERDVFVEFEYRTSVVGKKRWSPQFALALFNIRRNVERGLAIEEFACTACFPPDTTLADLAYALWELEVTARSKITSTLMLEAGYRYSPYRVITESFFSTELRQSVPSSSSRYFIGSALRLGLQFEALRPYRDSNVIPQGVYLSLGYEYEPSRLLDRFDVEDGILVPGYESFRVHRVRASGRYVRRLPGTVRGRDHALGMKLAGSAIVGGNVDSFFNEYVGGLVGARGYPFYALGGNETIWGQLSYYVPVFPDIRRQLLFMYLDKIYARFYADAALVWSGSVPGLSDARKDVGAELRASVGSFYLLPTAIFVSATYGLDEFDFRLDDDFVTPTGGREVRYGKSLQWHFGVLFGFDL